MGPICWAAIVEAVSQVGKRCFDGEHPEVIAELDRSRALLGERFKESGWSQEYLDGFRQQMGETEKSTEALCSNADATQFYLAFANSGPAHISLQTEEMLGRNGLPEWGACL